MPQPSAFFIGHQGINLPHGLSLKNSTGEQAKCRKSMNSRSYTLCEVPQGSGRGNSPLKSALKTCCAASPLFSGLRIRAGKFRVLVTLGISLKNKTAPLFGKPLTSRALIGLPLDGLKRKPIAQRDGCAVTPGGAA